MSDIVLKVPEGDKCDGCMFLNTETPFSPRCALFGWMKLDYSRLNGEEDVNSIKKYDACPKEQK